MRVVPIFFDILIGLVYCQAVTPLGSIYGMLDYLVLPLAWIEYDSLQNNETLCIWPDPQLFVWHYILCLLFNRNLEVAVLFLQLLNCKLQYFHLKDKLDRLSFF